MIKKTHGMRIFVLSFSVYTIMIPISLIVWISPCHAQDKETEELSNNGLLAKIEFSAFGGVSYFGPKNDLESNMSQSGFGDSSPPFFGTRFTPHPHSHKEFTYDFEVTLFYKQNRGISLNYGISDNVQVFGYDGHETSLGNSLNIQSKIFSVALSYCYQSKNERHNLQLGPALLIHRMDNLHLAIPSQISKDTKLGLLIAYSLNFVNKKHFFMALKTSYRWGPKNTIGPIVEESIIGIGTTNPETFTSTFLPTEVRLSTLNIGISAGFRILK